MGGESFQFTFFIFGAVENGVGFPDAWQKNLSQGGDGKPGRQKRMDRRVCLFNLRPALPSRSRRSGQAFSRIFSTSGTACPRNREINPLQSSLHFFWVHPASLFLPFPARKTKTSIRMSALCPNLHFLARLEPSLDRNIWWKRKEKDCWWIAAFSRG